MKRHHTIDLTEDDTFRTNPLSLWSSSHAMWQAVTQKRHWTAKEIIYTMFRREEWMVLLHGMNPFAGKRRVFEAMIQHMQNMTSIETLNGELPSDHLRRLENADTEITDFMVDDILAALAAPVGKHVVVQTCTWVSTYLIAVYDLFRKEKHDPHLWSRNMTRKMFGIDCDSREHYDTDSMAKGHRLLYSREFNIRTLATKMAPKDELVASSVVLVVPVCHRKHFWLYTVHVSEGIIEYYNSLPGYGRRKPTYSDGIVARKEYAFVRSRTRSRQPLPSDNDDVEIRFGTILDTMISPWDNISQRTSEDDKMPDVETFHAALLWFFKNYLGRDFRIVDGMPGRDVDVQENAVDCGIFVCLYAYLRIVCNLSYDNIVSLVRQTHIPLFREFLISVSFAEFLR